MKVFIIYKTSDVPLHVRGKWVKNVMKTNDFSLSIFLDYPHHYHHEDPNGHPYLKKKKKNRSKVFPRLKMPINSIKKKKRKVNK